VPKELLLKTCGLAGRLPQMMLFWIIGLLLKMLYIPPPLLPAWLPEMVTLVSVGLLLLLYIPPPSS
jgi:hypothetical protein